jgi:hypothetical protein
MPGKPSSSFCGHFETACIHRVLNDIPRFAAMTAVALGERFNALAILVTPAFVLAIIFSVRTSSFDHARRTTFFFFAKTRFLF